MARRVLDLWRGLAAERKSVGLGALVKWQMNGQLRAHATQALADIQLLDWSAAILVIESQMLEFAELYAGHPPSAPSIAYTICSLRVKPYFNYFSTSRFLLITSHLASNNA